jgi:hypothetical protein
VTALIYKAKREDVLQSPEGAWSCRSTGPVRRAFTIVSGRRVVSLSSHFNTAGRWPVLTLVVATLLRSSGGLIGLEE